MINQNEKKILLREGYEVYTKSVGSGDNKILLLHGGPGGCLECFEDMEKQLPLDKVTLIYYDQLGSYYSDKISDESLMTLGRYVEEVEQVRLALEIDQLILLGHSWGGMLAIEYALKYQNDGHLKGIVISNMTASNDSYETSVMEKRKKYLTKDDQEYLLRVEAKENYDDVRYKEIVFGKLYPQCICRLDPWPTCIDESKIAQNVYNKFQGNNEFIVTGTMKGWNRWDDLKDIHVPALTIGARHDTMSTSDIEKMGTLLANGDSLICPNGSHFAFLDDPEIYYVGLMKFITSL